MLEPSFVRSTRSVCPTCLRDLDAEVQTDVGGAWLVRTCPEHGEVRQKLSGHGEHWAELDRYYFRVNSDIRPQRDFIVRMTERCNLACPICLAKANTEETPDLDLRGLERLLSERRGIKVDLMAAEPTLREDLETWIRKVKAAGSVAALHTNGLRLADKDYARRLKEAGVDEVFLQFDGFDDEANKALRGRPLLKARLATLANLRELGIATSLIVVIARGVNEAQVGETLSFALRPENAFIREVFYLGLRMLGSARDAVDRETRAFADQSLMPDELVDLLTAQHPDIDRADIRRFNKVYFAMLSAFKVKKCLYVQHYLMVRDGEGGAKPIAEVLDLAALEKAADRYADAAGDPLRSRAGLLLALARQGLRPKALPVVGDLARLELLFRSGMNLAEVPGRMLLLGFITACDPWNFDAQVAENCGKGELSADGGFVESGAVANIRREARLLSTKRNPGRPATSRTRTEGEA